MLQKVVKRFILAVLLVTVAGCGGGNSDTNGKVTLSELTPTDLGGGLFSVRAVATYDNPTQTNLLGFDINLTASIGTAGGTPQVFEDTLRTNQGGVTSPRLYTIQQTTQPIFVTVTASSGGLFDKRQL